jgi:hypothetical protein
MEGKPDHVQLNPSIARGCQDADEQVFGKAA